MADRGTHPDVPVHESSERSFDELGGLLDGTLAFREILLRPGTPKENELSGQAYLASHGLPQFIFHVTTACAILRHNGLPIGKRDFMGSY